ncbi:hypothetical protein CEXT_162831 [Caerostris extrusa]|uniref:Uncharacterized protein n=1 Tax=Caerostris extrusa TaxID=172846 RepID=A0AAV4U8A6_CAEEX|nr:hypothetical protein CEXT_162831 [Caerostris extrusa]
MTNSKTGMINHYAFLPYMLALKRKGKSKRKKDNGYDSSSRVKRACAPRSSCGPSLPDVSAAKNWLKLVFKSVVNESLPLASLIQRGLSVFQTREFCGSSPDSKIVKLNAAGTPGSMRWQMTQETLRF